MLLRFLLLLALIIVVFAPSGSDGQAAPPRSRRNCSSNPLVCLNPRNRPAGPICCNRRCVDILGDPAHCGRCFNRCGFGFSCCRGRCVDLDRSRRNCGTCGNVCRRPLRCDFGICGY